MIQAKLKIDLVLNGPILTKSSTAGKPGIDTPVARTGQNKNIYIPYSLIKGKLREAWHELNSVVPTFNEGLLGEKSETLGNEYKPDISCLTFSDFQFSGENEIEGHLRYRIKIDPERGAIQQNALEVIESLFVPGEKYVFKGEIAIIVVDETTARRIARDLEMGLRWITCLGAKRTAGFGGLHEVSTKLEILNSENVELKSNQDFMRGLRLSLDKPFCVAKRRSIDNIFESETVLSGAVIRGSIATTIKLLVGLGPLQEINENSLPDRWKILGKHFSLIGFSHAFPVLKDSCQRPVVPPQSLIKFNKLPYKDSALMKGPFVLKNGTTAPSFAIDWKDDSDVLADFGWSNPPNHELRVRTAVDREKRKALKSQLFAYEMIIPDRHQWLLKVNFERIPAEYRLHVESQLKDILTQGIQKIGKTKAYADVAIDNNFTPVYESNLNPINNRWVITLQTPALLCNPAELNESSDANQLFQSYASAWRDISNRKLVLVEGSYFARQCLTGRYVTRRFQGQKPYNPFLLSEAGSVFVLQASGDIKDAQNEISRWLIQGLDLPGWAKEQYQEDWRTNPYLPENGFGEIAINLNCHSDRKPSEEEVIYVN